MASCIGAQHAHVRLDRTDREVADLARLLALLADELGIDLDRLAALDEVARNGGYVWTWEQAEASGLHDGEDAA